MSVQLQEATAALRKYFGYESFRPGQQEVVEALLEGRDALALMPTGAGKSLCFQIPALLLKGVTLVISPLVSLMQDQVTALINAGVPAAYVIGSMFPFEQQEVLSRAQQGEIKLLYVAPERLENPEFLEAVARIDIALVAVDEAHCMSQWGHDFRPSYLRIRSFIEDMPTRPSVAAFTATATEAVRNDIVKHLDLHAPLRVVTSFDRPNLHFAVEQVPKKDKTERVFKFIAAHPKESGIVYCATRNSVDELWQDLCDEGVRATRYHAGLSPAERNRNQRDFINEDAPIIVATNAFGMGIDKSNVRWVLHYNMTGTLEAYYQEAGRAGRDGEPAECLLLWCNGDIHTQEFFINNDSCEETSGEKLDAAMLESVRTRKRHLLTQMANYCHITTCLRAHILDYFGESYGTAGLEVSHAGGANCGNCSNCTGDTELVEVTDDARSVMRCVQEMRGRFGRVMCVRVLRGSKESSVLDARLNNLKCYGILKRPERYVRNLIDLLLVEGYLTLTTGDYPLLVLGPRAREASSENPDFHFYMRMDVHKTTRKSKSKTSAKTKLAVADLSDADKGLFESLRALRKTIADETNVPPYIVFSDATLRSMCAIKPKTREEFLQVSGVGELKLLRYGERFMAEIQSWAAAQ